jgi:hypothetical protein
MKSQLLEGVKISADASSEHAKILSPEALTFLLNCIANLILGVNSF